MNPLRKLAGQTAIYGLSSIVGRLLNYLLVPLHTRVFLPEAYGVVTEMYSYVAFLMIVLTYGFETSFFRFASNQEDRPRIYATSLISLLVSSLGFFILCWVFVGPIADYIQYPEYPEYIVWFALILATDAATSIPFAKLRLENRPLKFAILKLVNIGVNVLINVFFLMLCPWLLENGSTSIQDAVRDIYDPNMGVGYVFIANLVASLVTFLLLIPDMWKMSWKFDSELWRRMMRYGFPLLIGGLAGITNEMFSRMSMKYQLPKSIAMHDLGVFGACYKVAILMTLFIQTFRFAAEPFFFTQAREKNAKKLYAEVMHWFVIACSLIYLGVLIFMNIVKEFIGEAYHEGLVVVPILLMAQLFLGVFFNLSIWFKLNDRTYIGAWLAIFGSVLTLILNYLWVPEFGYVGASWATFVVYLTMLIASYLLGQKFYPIEYDLRRVIGYPVSVALMVWLYTKYLPMEGAISWVLKCLILLAFVGAVWLLEVRKKTVISSPST
ncbi:MAG TPA: polysaccharide biosynthesis C-terminal domain-containing protein [Flavobacteriales bacterium]|nr:polysaccharide biosynthesis C-terminal domain-containing protein [Flavobacteriales bacterium]HPH81217.1 polysaccharide biosynthesis C-terminal domain-containing protein [Flavobacteriales bacterium]